MTLHNTLHAWIPYENSSRWIYCIASRVKVESRGAVSMGNKSLFHCTVIVHKGAFRFVLFIPGRWDIFSGFMHHHLAANRKYTLTYTHNNKPRGKKVDTLVGNRTTDKL